MLVEVYYCKTFNTIIEIDDKFEKLLYPDNYQPHLYYELEKTALKAIPDTENISILGIYDENGTVLAEC